MPLPRVKPGEKITAGLMNALIEAANAQALTVAQGGGLALDRGVLYATIRQPIWVKLTGSISGGTYPFTQQFPDTGGTWTDGPLTGTAYEVTGNTSLTSGTYGHAWKQADGSWRFKASAC